jgi:predicted nucleic acid-binding protein
MAFVLDTSVALALALPDEAAPPEVRDRLLAGERIVVPGVFPYEVVNGLLVARRRGRVDHRTVQRALAAIEQLEPDIATPRSLTEIYEAAQKWELSSYDASYLALATSRGIALATLDARLADAARAAGVSVL